MLTTEIQPTSGKIFLQGREIGEKPLCTGEMGYCSQSDSLDPKLTVRQTLMTYLTLRGTENPNQVSYYTYLVCYYIINNYNHSRLLAK